MRETIRLLFMTVPSSSSFAGGECEAQSLNGMHVPKIVTYGESENFSFDWFYYLGL